VKWLQKILEICHFKTYQRSLLSCLLFLCTTISLYSQNQFHSVSSVYDHSASEWKILGTDSLGDDWDALLYLKWPLRNEWDHWTVDFKDYFYTIKLRWNQNPAQWELTGGDFIVKIKQKWRNDLNEWDIYYGDKKIKWKTNFPNQLDEWFFEIDKDNYFDMWTRYRADPRDWEFEDHAAAVPDQVKIAAIFICIYLANPKR